MDNLKYFLSKMLNDDEFRKVYSKFLKPDEIIDENMKKLSLALVRDDFSLETLLKNESKDLVGFALDLANNGIRKK